MLSPYHIAPCHKAAILAALNDARPGFLHGYPSAFAALAELLAPGELTFPVHAALLVSEPVTPLQLAAVARTFRCPVSISYGQSERVNLAFARYRDGTLSPYRFEPLYGVTENIEGGEIAGTSLWNDVMPLIRYRTGDVGVVDRHGYCAAIDGRAQDYLIDRYGHRIPGLSIVIDTGTWAFVRLYQIRQAVPGAIRLAIVGRHGPLSAQQRDFVLGAQRRRWGGFFDIELEEVSDIPPGAGGKHRLVDTRQRALATA